MKPSVLFATPTFDFSFCAEYQTSMMSTAIELTHQKIQMRARFVAGMCFIDLARNLLVQHFLHETECTDLFFVDSDVGWDYKVVQRFLEYPQEVVGGLVPKRWDKEPFHDRALNGKVEDGLVGTLEVPTAFLRLKRSAFEKLDAAYPEYAEYETMGNGKPYFQMGFVNKHFCCEDIFFCRQWCAMGGSIWIDPNVRFTHRGQRFWEGNFLEHGMKEGFLQTTQVPVEPQSIPLSIAS
jgi:hypothetical protein